MRSVADGSQDSASCTAQRDAATQHCTNGCTPCATHPHSSQKSLAVTHEAVQLSGRRLRGPWNARM